jgi:hypothetical protein
MCHLSFSPGKYGQIASLLEKTWPIFQQVEGIKRPKDINQKQNQEVEYYTACLNLFFIEL